MFLNQGNPKWWSDFLNGVTVHPKAPAPAMNGHKSVPAANGGSNEPPSAYGHRLDDLGPAFDQESPKPAATPQCSKAADSKTVQEYQKILDNIMALVEKPFDPSLPANVLQKQVRNLLKHQRLVLPSEKRKIKDIIEYMISDDMEKNLDLWFGKATKTDQEILVRFGEDVVFASLGMYNHWESLPEGRLALLLLMDQFRRNIYRNNKQMYDCDPKCQEIVQETIDLEMQNEYRPIEWVFFCLVLTHSEDVKLQRMCLQQWEKCQKERLEPEDPLNVFWDVFNRHLVVVEKYGRFPHRNEIYDRPCTPEELEFLENGSFRFDLPLKKTASGKFTFISRGKMLWSIAREHVVSQMRMSSVVKLFKNAGGASLLLQAAQQARAETYKISWETPDQSIGAAVQMISSQANLRIGDTAPNFIAQTQNGPVNFYEYLGDSWGMLCSHPAVFTPVCTTELGYMAHLDNAGEFQKRNIKVLGLSVNTPLEHDVWLQDIEKSSGCAVKYPVICDKDRRVAMMYGMLDQTNFMDEDEAAGMTMTMRNVFVVGPSKRIEMVFHYPAPTGRSFKELLRVIDALQLSAKYHVATPVNWEPGMPTVVLPFISDEEAFARFGSVNKKTDYLRYVDDPSAKKN